VLLTLGALGFGLLGQGMWGSAATYSFFLGAVMLSSWISGFGPGLLSTLLGTVTADYFLLAPIHQLTFDASRVVQLSAFVSIALLISSLNDSRRRALAAVAAARAHLEDRVAERTAELARSNDSLRAEIERRTRSESAFRRLIDAAPDAILVIDAGGRIVTVNQEAERMFGYAREALLGRDVEMIIPERFRAAHHAKRARFGDSPSPRPVSGELAAMRADGSEVPVEIRVSPLDTGAGSTIVGVVRDVTERHRAQSVQRHLLHALGERVKELSALHAAGRLLNEPRGPAELLPQIVELLPGAWQYPEIASARNSARGIDARTAGFTATPWQQRAEFPAGGGERGVIELAYSQARPTASEGPFLDEERNLIDSLGAMLRAYFERLDMEEQRLELARSEASRHQAQEANAAKDRFLATLSHELRSPLNVMLGWIQLLRKDQSNPEAVALGLGVLERNVQLQSKLIEDLLDVSRIVAGKLRLDRRQVDLAAVTANAVDATRPAAREKNVALTAAITPSLWIDADPERLQQVVLNLLTNALKFTPPDGSIDVRVEGIGRHAQIVIRDSGIGIGHDLLPRIFERFQQGDGAAAGKYRGLGLGLAIVEHIVTQHGGSIAASSAGPGCGSTFTVTLPLLPREASVPEPARPAAVEPCLLSGVRVLVVDNEASARTRLRDLLERVGAETTVVATASEALEIARDNRPDVLLIDIAMPGDDGYALIRRIRASTDAAHLPAVALSRRVDVETRTRAAEAGFQQYLSKPVDAALLAQTLARLVYHPDAPAA
jgi:PAS domain S-box-containing protein